MKLLIGIVVGFGFLMVVAAVIAAVVWALSHASKVRNATVSLAGTLGWKPITPNRAPADTWYGGVGQDRRVAIKIVALRNPMATSGSRHSPYLRIVMEVLLSRPLGAMALRRIGDTSSLHRFEEAFSVENASRFGPETRAAMTGFLALGYRTGLQGTSYRTSPGTRNLWVKDRALIQPGPLDPAVLPDARTVLVYDHPYPAIDVDAFGKLLHEMATVAWALERGR